MLAAVVLIVAITAFSWAAIVGSDRMVQPPRSSDCRTPAHLGIAYEAINYDRATDARFSSEPDPTRCATPTTVELGEELVSADGVPLAAWYIPAEEDASDAPTIVFAHGWTGSKSTVIDVLPMVHPRYNAVMFDFRNHGQSGASPTTQGVREQHDLAAVVDWVVDRTDSVDIVVWGQSMGGHTAVNVAATDERVDALVLDSLHSRLAVPYALRAEEEYPIGRFGAVAALAGMVGAFVRTGVNVWSAEPIDAIGRLDDTPVLVIRGELDRTIPAPDTDSLVGAARAAKVDVRLVTCPGGGHADLAWTCPDLYRASLLAFLDEVSGD